MTPADKTCRTAIPKESSGAWAGFPWITVTVLTTFNGEQGLFMFFCSFSLIFQSACLTSSDSLVPSLVSPVQQRGAVQVTLQGGAFHSRLLYRGTTGAGSSGQEGGSSGKILVRFYSPQQGWLAQGLSGPILPGGSHHPGLVARALSHPGHPPGQCSCPSPGNFGFSSITEGVPVPRASRATLAASSLTL